MDNKNLFSRRTFLSGMALAGLSTALGTGGVALSSCSRRDGGTSVPFRPEEEWKYPRELPDKAVDGKEIKVGLIGCGRRGIGAMIDLLNAGDGIKVTAFGDIFPEAIAEARKTLREKYNQEVADVNCFVGFDSYQKVIASDVDLVLLTTPPAFRPIQFKAAVEAGKHAFLEKPVAVDPVGARLVIATSKIAVSKGLCVVTGTQRRHHRKYIEAYRQIQSGLIGNIVSADVCWNTGSHWIKFKKPEWTDMEGMLRDWGNWNWLSGDHIVEQHVHNIDVVSWFLDRKPVQAVAMGARQRRLTGDQYDMFSTDFIFEGGVHVHSMCRQIDGCDNGVFEIIYGTKGYWYNREGIKDWNDNVLWKYDGEREKQTYKQNNAYVLEHVDLINHIRRGKAYSEAEDSAVSTLAAVMARMSAYTGKKVTWEQVMVSDMNLVPEELSLRNLDMSAYSVPVPGMKKEPKLR